MPKGALALLNPSSWVIDLPTIHRAAGFRFVIFTNDHEPAHVHAIGAGGEARIDLGVGKEAPTLAWVQGLSNAEVRRVVAEVAQERVHLRDAWVRLHRSEES